MIFVLIFEIFFINFFLRCTFSLNCVEEESDILFLVDSSSSVCQSNNLDDSRCMWNGIQKLLLEVVSFIPLQNSKHRVGLILFSSKFIGVPLTEDKQFLLKSIESLTFLSGNTNISGALKHARILLSSSPTPKKVIVLLTDGLSNVDVEKTFYEARVNKEGGLTHLVVGLGKYIDEYELKEVASDPTSQNFIEAPDLSLLNSTTTQILQRLTCSSFPFSEPCKDKRVDLCFVLDSSGSIMAKKGNETIKYPNWELIKNFIISIIQNLNMSEARVALILFSHKASIELYLNNSLDKENLIQKIKQIKIIGSETNTFAALKLLNDVIFNFSNGDRPDVSNVAIVMTDGQSSVKIESTLPEANRAKKLGVRVFVVGFTNEINEHELKGIASQPLENHYFSRASFSEAKTVVSNLLWNVCHKPCIEQDPNKCSKSSEHKKCKTNEHLIWKKKEKTILVAHDYARLTHIKSPEVCQNICLQEEKCRSIEYIPSFEICTVSYFILNEAQSSVRNDEQVDYYEWSCV